MKETKQMFKKRTAQTLYKRGGNRRLKEDDANGPTGDSESKDPHHEQEGYFALLATSVRSESVQSLA